MARNFRTFVFALASGVALAASTGVAAVAQTADPDAKPRFDTAIDAFEAADKTDMPPKCATLFVGSSTVRFWASLKEDFPTRTVINRGFGGSTVWEVDDYFSRVVTAYHPKAIVFYAGDNDLAGVPARDGKPAVPGHTPDQVYADFVKFMKLKNKQLGKTPVWFIAVKPSKLRWDIQDKMTAVNVKVKALADKRNDLAYIDIVPTMLKPDGTPKDIFREDRLHMTPEGYALWTPIVEKSLDAGQKAKAPGCP
ncbi:MAG: GDSL-type esterase/lipase family protein [Alphaproteobacteria bacterium]